ncbi:unnamed protein product [Lactuca virosa]|uniref:Uncharacterized protein n=1 Tax=Lactuca virosa TaxID=75947 RepID=A0AAU9M7Q9_9ASTR|nr:unnamed protein product [Lactuca virosa]
MLIISSYSFRKDMKRRSVKEGRFEVKHVEIEPNNVRFTDAFQRSTIAIIIKSPTAFVLLTACSKLAGMETSGDSELSSDDVWRCATGVRVNSRRSDFNFFCTKSRRDEFPNKNLLHNLLFTFHHLYPR